MVISNVFSCTQMGSQGLVGFPSECWCRLLPEIYYTHDGCHASNFWRKDENWWKMNETEAFANIRAFGFCWNWYRSHILSLPSRSIINSFNFTSNSETRKPLLFFPLSPTFDILPTLFSQSNFIDPVPLRWKSPQPKWRCPRLGWAPVRLRGGLLNFPSK